MNNSTEKEVWKDIKGYEGYYQVSNLGRFKGVARLDGRGYRQKERIMNGYCNGHGYVHAYGCRDGKRKTFKVHRLVAEAFIPNPDNLPCVNHKDGIRDNNHVNNLEWCSYSYNNVYGDRLQKIRDSGGWKKSRKPIYVIKDGEREWFNSATEAAKKYDLDKPNISACLNGRIKTHKGFKFEYA